MSELRRWIVMACLCLSAAAIYLLPYSTEVYYKPLQTALGVDNQAIGYLMSTLGVVNFLGYIPGGWLADRFSPRVLLSFSLCATGLIGLYFATFPPYWACILVYAGWSLTSILTFWSALIKATRDWGGEDEQGRAFGFLEGGRGVIRFALSSLGVAVLGWVAGEKAGFSAVVTLYASLNIGLGVAVWFALRPEKGERVPPNRTPSVVAELQAAGFDAVLRVLKMPAIWLIALVILSAYTLYLGSFYFNPYATDAFGLGVVLAGYLASGKMLLRPLSAAGAGFVGDAVGASRVLAVAFFVAFVSFGIFAILPSQSALLTLDEVEDGRGLLETLSAPETSGERALAEKLGDDLRKEIAEVEGAPEPVVARVLGALNRSLNQSDLLGGAEVELRPLTARLLDGAESEEVRIRAHRLLVEDVLPGTFTPFSEARAKSGPPWTMLVLLLVNVGAATFALYALRGVYYALLEEASVPTALTGVAVGFVSILGFTPDIFVPPLVGHLLDRYPGGVGYQYVFGLDAIFALVGLGVTLAFIALLRRGQAAEGEDARI